MKRTVRFAVILGAMAAAATSADAFKIDWMTNTTAHNLGLMEGNSYTIKARTDENYLRFELRPVFRGSVTFLT